MPTLKSGALLPRTTECEQTGAGTLLLCATSKVTPEHPMVW